MCGIVGYIGKKNAKPFLLEGLKALEYRGYDSAGLYVSGHYPIKRTGNVLSLAEAVPETVSGTAGIAHTRWATHGPPTEANAHPHTDASGTVFLVHNGIIENHAELRTIFEATGVTFQSQTDSEVLAQLIADHYGPGVMLEDAVREALRYVRGTYGIVVASAREPDVLVAARLGSPLMLGVSRDGYYLASDATPILPHTRNVLYLDDGEMIVVRKDGYQLFSRERTPVDRAIETLEWDIESAQKKGFEHFMLKEIMEVPEVLENAFRGRLSTEEGEVHLGGLRDAMDRLKQAKRIVITGCGSAYYAGLVGEQLIEEFAGIPVEVEIASELRYRRFTMNPKEAVLIAVSQSGETLDTLEAIREAKRHGMLTLGIVNVVGSTVARETDAGVYNHAGPEISVASTKAFISQIGIFSLIALLLGRQDGLSAAHGVELTAELAKLPEKARKVLAQRAHIEQIAKKYLGMQSAFFLGRKFQCPVAFEGAIKLKEISYVHAEGYGAGEMKHGPIALVDETFPSVVLVPKDALYEKTKSNIQELRARGGKVIAVTTEGCVEDIARIADDVISVPSTHEAFLPMLTTLPLQLFAYYVAKERGLSVDQPRNLAKSVTVE